MIKLQKEKAGQNGESDTCTQHVALCTDGAAVQMVLSRSAPAAHSMH